MRPGRTIYLAEEASTWRLMYFFSFLFFFLGGDSSKCVRELGLFFALDHCLISSRVSWVNSSVSGGVALFILRLCEQTLQRRDRQAGSPAGAAARWTRVLPPPTGSRLKRLFDEDDDK